jgi:hypothetical protein
MKARYERKMQITRVAEDYHRSSTNRITGPSGSDRRRDASRLRFFVRKGSTYHTFPAQSASQLQTHKEEKMAKSANQAGTKSNSSGQQTSGDTQLTKQEGKLTLKVPKAAAGAKAPGSALNTFFARITPDASPGWNTLTINGLPANTRVISVWMTEWVQGNFSHAGGAWYTTSSVQLYASGTRCRVRFYLDWGSHLPSGCMVIYGPG